MSKKNILCLFLLKVGMIGNDNTIAMIVKNFPQLVELEFPETVISNFQLSEISKLKHLQLLCLDIKEVSSLEFYRGIFKSMPLKKIKVSLSNLNFPTFVNGLIQAVPQLEELIINSGYWHNEWVDYSMEEFNTLLASTSHLKQLSLPASINIRDLQGLLIKNPRILWLGFTPSTVTFIRTIKGDLIQIICFEDTIERLEVPRYGKIQ